MIRWGLERMSLVQSAWSRYQADDGPLMAAAVAYYVGLSLFPLLLMLIAGVGWFLKSTALGQSAEQEVLQAVSLNLSPMLGEQVREMLAQVQDRSGIHGPLGFAGVLVTALAAFSQLERAFDRIWGVPHPTDAGLLQKAVNLLIQRGTAFLLLLLAGFFLVTILVSGVMLSAVRSAASSVIETPDLIWRMMQGGLSFVLNALLFTVLYRWLPKSRLRWREAAHGGVLAAALWEVGRHVLASFLIGTKYTSAYGIVGTFIAILLWCYYAVTILFLGAEFVRVSTRFGHRPPRNATVPAAIRPTSRSPV